MKTQTKPSKQTVAVRHTERKVSGPANLEQNGHTHVRVLHNSPPRSGEKLGELLKVELALVQEKQAVDEVTSTIKAQRDNLHVDLDAYFGEYGTGDKENHLVLLPQGDQPGIDVRKDTFNKTYWAVDDAFKSPDPEVMKAACLLAEKGFRRINQESRWVCTILEPEVTIIKRPKKSSKQESDAFQS